MEKWHVYQLRSDTELLYVGYSRRLKKRLNEHKSLKPWWPEVTDIRSEEFTSEDDARQREKELWVSERPKHNRVSPFRTEEEERERAREYETTRRVRTPEFKQWFRDYQRERERTPERKAYMRDYRRTHQRKDKKRWQQTGPGLF
jgi:predicted GIY-YIG superfamily endonuclease